MLCYSINTMGDTKAKVRPSDYTDCGIYSLSDSTGIRYIGQSKKISHRYKQHCSIFQNNGNTKRQSWLRKLIKNGSLPTLDVVELTDDLDNREIYWIKYYKKNGCNLVNTADGGKTNGHMLRIKKNMPWGNKWSPLQHFLIMSKRNVKTIRALGYTDRADQLEKKYNDVYVKVLKAVKIMGKDEFNLRYMERYGIKW